MSAIMYCEFERVFVVFCNFIGFLCSFQRLLPLCFILIGA